MIWFTSDHHFGHENIIKYQRRPFDDAKQMDAAMIDAWNNVVAKDDLVYHLGDFTLGGEGLAKAYFAMLNGRIKMLAYPWHHDKRWLRIANEIPNVTLVSPLTVLDFGHPAIITLCHYPLEEWERKFHGAWMLHGHSHGELEHTRDTKPILDVTVDNAYQLMGVYRPFSFAEIAPIMRKRGGINVYRMAKG